MRIVYLGTGKIGAPAFRALLASKKHEILGAITQPDKPVGRHQELQASLIKQVAFEKNIPVFQPEKINTPEALDWIRKFQPELIVVCAYGQILKKDLLKIPPRGCINIHASLLPRHRGASCIPSAILNGDTQTGITIIQMDEGLDTGDILLQESTPIHDEDTSASLHDRLAELAASTLLRILDFMEQGKLLPKKQNPILATYSSKLKKENGLIHWEKTAQEIHGLIRAMIPWPSAYTYLDKKILKIFSAKIQLSSNGKPGEILRAGEQGISVATGKGSLLITEIQLEGKKKMSVAEFLRGHHLQIGKILRLNEATLS